MRPFLEVLPWQPDSSLAALNRQFKVVRGMTPRAYRAHFRED